MLESALLHDILTSVCTQTIQQIKYPLHILLISMNRMITIRLFWLLLSWLYWLVTTSGACVELLKGHKHFTSNGNA